jgi:hypothetical protein
VHDTQATSNKGAKVIFAAPMKLGFAAPINFKQLILLDNDGRTVLINSSTDNNLKCSPFD